MRWTLSEAWWFVSSGFVTCLGPPAPCKDFGAQCMSSLFHTGMSLRYGSLPGGILASTCCLYVFLLLYIAEAWMAFSFTFLSIMIYLTLSYLHAFLFIIFPLELASISQRRSKITASPDFAFSCIPFSSSLISLPLLSVPTITTYSLSFFGKAFSERTSKWEGLRRADSDHGMKT